MKVDIKKAKEVCDNYIKELGYEGYKLDSFSTFGCNYRFHYCKIRWFSDNSWIRIILDDRFEIVEFGRDQIVR